MGTDNLWDVIEEQARRLVPLQAALTSKQTEKLLKCTYQEPESYWHNTGADVDVREQEEHQVADHTSKERRHLLLPIAY